MKITAAIMAAAVSAAVISFSAAAADSGCVLSHESGVYCGKQYVCIQAEKNSEVFYTTDGSKPDEDSEPYDGKPVVIGENTVIKTVAYIDGEEVGRDSASIKIRTATPKASARSGTYSEPVSLTLSCSDKSAEIRYTVDGSVPTGKSPLYTVPISVTKDAVIKFAAFGENRAKSYIVTRKYVINEDVYDDKHRQELFEAVNDVRAEYGLAPFEELSELSDIAQQRAVECSGYFSHWRIDGTKWDFLLDAAGLARNHRAENIAYYYPTAEQALASWMNDYAHRANILDPDLKYIGLGYYNNGGCGYWTQLFIGEE